MSLFIGEQTFQLVKLNLSNVLQNSKGKIKQNCKQFFASSNGMITYVFYKGKQTLTGETSHNGRMREYLKHNNDHLAL